MKTTDMLLSGCLIFSLILCAWTSAKLRYAIGQSENYFSVRQGILYAIETLPVLAMGAVHIPLPLFYVLFYMLNCLHPLFARERKNSEWLFVNVRFLLFVAPHLVLLGVLALCAQSNVRIILDESSLRVFSLAAITLMVAILNLILLYFLSKKHLYIFSFNPGELRLFSRFVWFCIVSVVLDSIPCLFLLPTRFPILFLIGSNMLLLLMAVLYAIHIYDITRDAYLKEECLALQEATLAQHFRTIQLEHEAYVDALTGTYTRQYVLTNMMNMLKNGESFVVAFLDLDRLKQVNDHQGHAAGDQYLQRFSTNMKANLRPNDIFARYGGDEFLILFPDCDIQTVDARFKQVQKAASASPPAGWGTPFSYGLAQAQPDIGLSDEEWISMADHAMYENKVGRRAHEEGGI